MIVFQVDRRGAEAGQGWAGGTREVRLLPEEAGAVRLRRRDLHQDGRHQGARGAAHRGAPLGRREYTTIYTSTQIYPYCIVKDWVEDSSVLWK